MRTRRLPQDALYPSQRKRCFVGDQEYARLYGRLADLIATSDVDIAPLRLVADAYLLAARRNMPEFTW